MLLFSLLFTDSCFFFQKEDVKQRARISIATELHLENGKAAENLWTNLKIMLSKRRAKLRDVDVCAEARKPVEELNYLSWLFPYVKVRSTR